MTASGPAAATVFEGRAGLEAGGGHDDNLLLSAPSAETGALTRIGGAYAGLEPTLSLGLGGGGYQLALSYLGDARMAADAGRLLWQQVGLEARAPWFGPLRVTLGGFAGRFDASRFADEHYRFTGGELRLRLPLGTSVQVAGRYRAEWRRLAVADSMDVAQAGDLGLVIDPTSWLAIGPRASLAYVVPGDTAVAARFLRARAGLDAVASFSAWEISASGFGGSAGITGARETLWGGRLDVRVELGRGLGGDFGLFATFDQTVSTSSTPSDYARRAANLGVWVTASARTAPSRPPPATDLAPRVDEAGRVRFRVRAPAAASVSVVGSWNEWEAPGTPLVETREPGLWEGFAALAAGTHRYHFLVDGRATRPPGAPRYAPDGFGGDDGVVDVTGPGPGVTP